MTRSPAQTSEAPRTRAVTAAVVTALGAMAALVPGCEGKEAERPQPPSMSSLVQAYETPTGVISQGTIDGVTDAIVRAVEQIDELDAALDGLLAAIDESLQEVFGDDSMDAGPAARAAGIGSRRHTLTVDGEGYLRISHICHGWGPDAPIDPEVNGTAELTATFTENGLEPVIWGVAEGCKYTINGSNIAIQGNVSLYLGDLAQFESARQSPILFGLSVRLDVDAGTVVDGGFDFRVCPTSAPSCPVGNIEFRIDLPTEGHVVFFVNADRISGGIRTRDGTWSCSFSESTCQKPDGTTITIPELSF